MLSVPPLALVWAVFGGPAGGAVGNILGSVVDGVFNQSAADTASDKARENRSTAYQATVKDMKAAGLNPILAYSQGATATSSVPQSAPMNMGGAVQSAMQLRAQESQIANTVAQTHLTQATAAKTVQEARLAKVNANTAAALGYDPRGLSTLGTAASAAKSLYEAGDRFIKNRPPDDPKSWADIIRDKFK